MTEIEVKIQIPDIHKAAEKVIAQGAQLKKERYYEENILYDLSDHSLIQRKQALRVRKIQKKYFLTFKGSPQKSRKFKIREEYETEVKNGKQLKIILKKLGFIPVFHYKKYRTVYIKGRLKICLDETCVGNFIEFEGEQHKIVEFASKLGYSRKDFIKSDYIQLIKNGMGSTLA
ncbi:MAG: class IV adenylate cyclase [Acidobacteriota bacterium]|nr:class IV adenylate cyclase [Acidobacteriota bacterium]